MRPFLLLYALALFARLVLVALFPHPGYADSSYYVDVARTLAATGRFEVDFVWIFAEVGGTLPSDPVLPIPSNAHWMPLASIVQVPFIALLGPSGWSSQLPFALIGSLAAPMTYAIAREAGASKLVASAAGVLTAIPALTLIYMAQPDNFSLFQPLVLGALWMGARGLRGDGRAFVVAGLLAGLATLSRNDGVLVLAALGLIFLLNRFRARRRSDTDAPAAAASPTPRPLPFAAAAACVGLFLLAVGPWWLRQLAVFGSLSPSTASGKVLFIRSMAEWNSITIPATLSHFLGQGIGPLVASRVEGLGAAISIYSTLVGGLVLGPFMLVGAWLRRRDDAFRPFFVYAILLFAFSALVSAVHVPGGTFIHSAVALAPHSYILAAEGIAALVGWAAARRRGWNREAAQRVFVGAAVAWSIAIAIVGASFVLAGWTRELNERQAVARALDATGAPRSDRIMSIDAAGYRYYTGRGGTVLVNDPLPTIEQVARAYAIRWLVVERDDAVDAVAPILAGERPSWVGPPILAIPASGPTDVGVYPVCLEAGDDRCAEEVGA